MKAAMAGVHLAICFFIGPNEGSMIFSTTALSAKYDCGFVGYSQRENFISGKEVVTKERTER